MKNDQNLNKLGYNKFWDVKLRPLYVIVWGVGLAVIVKTITDSIINLQTLNNYEKKR